MADATNIKNLIINAGNGTYQLSAGEGGGGDIYAELGVTPERFAELLGRDFYCPLMPEAPTESTLTYIDTDGSVNHFAIGQECRVPVDESSEYVFYKFAGVYKGDAVWLEAVGGTPVIKGVTDLSIQSIYGESIAQTTANCYVVKSEGKYKFPLVFGNAIEKGRINYPAFTNNGGEYSHDFVDYAGTPISSPYIEEVSASAESVQLSIADTDGVFTDLRIVDGESCRHVQFKVDSVPPTGANGVISVKDADGTIMWNWHIWVWKDDLSPVGIMNSSGVKYHILPVNLGSKWDDSSKTHIKNWFYQWGRPTPILCPAAYDSADNHTSYGVLGYASEAKAENIQTGIRNPNKFYTNDEAPYNWFGTASYYNLWNANCKSTGNSDNNVVKTVYDPCPVGFKMPNGNAFTYFSKTNVVGSFSNGWYFKRYLGDTTGVFFPVSGGRIASTGLLSNVGSYGYVWLSSAYSQNSAHFQGFSSSIVNPQNYRYRANSCSVRPAQDDNFELPTHKLTININGDTQDPAGYKASIYQLNKYTDESGNVVEELGNLIGEQTTPTETYEMTWGTEYKIIYSAIAGFKTPAAQSYVADTISRSILATYKYTPYTDLSKINIYGDSILQNTANCYVIKETGRYKFPLVFGNAIKNGQVNAASYTKVKGEYSHDFVDYNGAVITSPYIEEVSGTVDSVQLSIADTDGVFADMGIMNGDACRYVGIEVSNIPDTGANGVISVKDTSGVIMWSWHIWVWPHDLTPVEITNNTGVRYNILPVNLATKLDTADSINKTTGWKNWFYQWGRPTPLLCPASYNSTSNHAKYGPLNFSIASTAASIQMGLQNPTAFYYNGSSPYNWFGTASYYNLWDANCVTTGNSDNNVEKTVYDPCPVGFKMPNGNTFTYFSKTNVVGSFSNGRYFKRNADDATGVFFPASGYRGYSDGLLGGVGSSGSVWLSSTGNLNNTHSLGFSSNVANPQNYDKRASGYSVRPVQE